MFTRLFRRPKEVQPKADEPKEAAVSQGQPEIWIDVGAHQGEYTLQSAVANQNLRVYAFEPNLKLAMALAIKAPNYTVLPMAIGERNGTQDFFLTEPAACSSLLPFEDDGLAQWIGGESIERKGTIPVPVIGLDTFMDLAEIDRVEFLKIDAQGADLAVVRSAAGRLKDIRRICLEVQVTPFDLYAGAARKQDVLDFLGPAGFRVVQVQPQTHGQEEVLTFERD
jgi:FkbM family methyltransferase